MGQFQIGDRVRVKDRLGWPGGYKIAGWEGRVVDVKTDPAGNVIMLASGTGYRMGFSEQELEKAERLERLGQA